MAIHDPLCREIPRATDTGMPLNRHVRMCPECAGTGFAEDGPDPRGRVGWCAACNGLGWYAFISTADLVRTALAGAGMVAIVFGMMAIAP